MSKTKLPRGTKAGITYVGSLLKRLEYLEDSEFKRKCWTDDAKRAAGYSANVSFDVVWEAALKALLKEKNGK